MRYNMIKDDGKAKYEIENEEYRTEYELDDENI
jgi:hypothetical protein